MEEYRASRAALVDHLKRHALRTDGPFELSSGGTSPWYLDGRQTTYDGPGGRLVGQCVHHLLAPEATAVGGMTMGADPVALATVLLADRPLKAFSVRKKEKRHGAAGRLVGPVTVEDLAVVVDDTTTTGASLATATSVLREAGIDVVQAIVVVDRSDGKAASRLAAIGVPFAAVVVPADLGITDEVVA